MTGSIKKETRGLTSKSKRPSAFTVTIMSPGRVTCVKSAKSPFVMNVWLLVCKIVRCLPVYVLIRTIKGLIEI